ncbi:hypothetical protein DV515_00003292 [Chloebia gouldiae]|uniref:Uncharacterized protein n=1 Tax=Chloebia gouldiae TaxID=44316 RepID=A0A3L8STG4_CHLGU|nr:hypothetical protein DV515_00003292 [Chloebia gouldiae]
MACARPRPHRAEGGGSARVRRRRCPGCAGQSPGLARPGPGCCSPSPAAAELPLGQLPRASCSAGHRAGRAAYPLPELLPGAVGKEGGGGHPARAARLPLARAPSAASALPAPSLILQKAHLKV